MAPLTPDRTALADPVAQHAATARPAVAVPQAASLAVPLAALCLGAAAMGVSPVFVRYASAEIGPFASAFWRVALSLPLLYAWMRFDEARFPAAGSLAVRPLVGRGAALAGLAFTGDLCFWHLAILGTSVANATFFATTAPVFVVLATWLVVRSRPGAGTLGGLALCLGGGAALLGESLEIAPARVTGDLQGVATAMFFGLYFLAVDRARRRAGAARVTFGLSLVTAALMGVVALALDHGRFWPVSGGGWVTLVALAWISHAGGQGLLSVALGRLPVVFSSLVIFLEAIVAAAAGSLWLGEPLTVVQCLGGALILVGIWTARPRRESAA